MISCGEIPLIGDIAAEHARRSPLYASIAALVVDVDTPEGADRAVDELVEQVLVWLARPAVARSALGNGRRRGHSSWCRTTQESRQEGQTGA